MAKAPPENLLNATIVDYPAPVQKKLRSIRKLIFETAAKTEGVGPLEETLKWGQLSYLTTASKSGSTLRIDRVKGRDDVVALFCHCQTDLVKTFREIYPDVFEFEGNRAVMMKTAAALPKKELAHCIALALTYHARKKAK